MTIEVVIFIFFIIIGAEATNFENVFLISSLITLEDKESLILIFNNLYFRSFILIIEKCDEIFIVIIITKCNKITNIEINQVQRFFFKTNINLIRYLTCLFDNA